MSFKTHGLLLNDLLNILACLPNHWLNILDLLPQKSERRKGKGKRTIRWEKRRARNTFGTKTRQSVPVVQKMMNTEMRTKEALGCSLSTAEMATPSTHMMVTLYTDIPTYLHRFT